MQKSYIRILISLAAGILPPCFFIFRITDFQNAVFGCLIIILSSSSALGIFSRLSKEKIRPEGHIPENIDTLFNVKYQVEKMTLNLVDIMGKILKKTTEGSDEANAVVDYFIGIPGETKSSFGSSYISQMIKKNEDVLQKAGNLFQDISKMNSELMDQVKHATKKMEGIQKFVSEINSNAIHTRILALNAMIEAARAGGKYAAGFAVVADEVKKMADRSDLIASSISTIADDSGKIMNSLQQEMQIRISEGLTGMKSVEKDLMETFGTLKTGIDNISEAIEIVTLNYQTIEKDIKGVIVALQYQDITSQQLDNVISFLSAFLPKEKQELLSEKTQLQTGSYKSKDSKHTNLSDEIEDDITFF
ncbi:Methyl-accepting chemotaxis protein [Desulfonema limicola]|uniref:Methyl-accepting chemotaxis protein n=1 Tax=Desulfonema limicola TaxID=45656 RepID=A0A975B373_9BACT|nr:methyl-accepting chemotaxis protein [Desulfonema limicola]QTA77949.1 Methyl-accepting chemotaxis protein [Desulfonema limicola]